MINSSLLNERRGAGIRPANRQTSRASGPTRLDSVLFLALMSGPPKFRARDLTASLAGEVDAMVGIQVGIWLCGAVWVFARLYPSLARHGRIPPLYPAQVLAALLIVALSLSLGDSPGILLTAFTLGQFAVMFAFSWLFTYRYGVNVFLRHLFVGLSGLLLLIVAAVIWAPDFVVVGNFRVRGDYIAPTGAVAAMALVSCLSGVPPLRVGVFWLAVALFGSLLAFSQTRTAYIAFVVYLVMGSVYGAGLRVRKLVPLLAVLALTIFLLDAFSATTGYMVRETESLQTLSDRVPLWEYLTAAVMRESPLIGLGYYAASRVLAPQHNELLGNAHSVIFEILVGGGLLAAAFYFLLCGSLLWYAAHLLRARSARPTAIALWGLLAVTMVQAVTGSDGLNAGPVGFTFWALPTLLTTVWRETERTTSARISRRMADATPRQLQAAGLRR